MKKYICLLIAFIGINFSMLGQRDAQKIVDTYNKGVDCERRGDYKNALSYFKQTYELRVSQNEAPSF